MNSVNKVNNMNLIVKTFTIISIINIAFCDYVAEITVLNKFYNKNGSIKSLNTGLVDEADVKCKCATSTVPTRGEIGKLFMQHDIHGFGTSRGIAADIYVRPQDDASVTENCNGININIAHPFVQNTGKVLKFIYPNLNFNNDQTLAMAKMLIGSCGDIINLDGVKNKFVALEINTDRLLMI